MYKGTIVVKNKGLLIPEAYLKIVQEKCKSSVGILSFSVEHKALQQLSQGTPLALEDIKDYQEQDKDKRVLFFFGASDVAIPDNALPPYAVLSDSKQVLVNALIEGAFPGVAQEKSTMPPEFFLANTYLHPRLKQLWGFSGENLVKFSDMLRDPLFQTDVKAQMGERGVVCLLTANDELITIEKNDTRGTFPWGWTSNAYGYKEAEGTGVHATDSTPRKLSIKDRLLGNKPADTGDPADKTGDGGSSPGPLNVQQPKTATKLAFDENAKIYPPKNADGTWKLEGKPLKQWYIDTFGFKPGNYGEYPGIPAKKMKIKSFSDLSSAQIQGPSFPADTTIPGKEGAEPTLPGQIAMLSKEERVDIISNFINDSQIKKAIDKAGQEMEAPGSHKEKESKIPSIIEQLGVTREQFNMWPLHVLREMGRDYPDAIAGIAFNERGLVNYLVKQVAALKAELDKKPGEIVEEPKKIEAEPVKPKAERKRFAF